MKNFQLLNQNSFAQVIKQSVKTMHFGTVTVLRLSACNWSLNHTYRLRLYLRQTSRMGSMAWQQMMVFILNICIWRQRSKKNANADVKCDQGLKPYRWSKIQNRFYFHLRIQQLSVKSHLWSQCSFPHQKIRGNVSILKYSDSSFVMIVYDNFLNSIFKFLKITNTFKWYCCTSTCCSTEIWGTIQFFLNT